MAWERRRRRLSARDGASAPNVVAPRCRRCCCSGPTPACLILVLDVQLSVIFDGPILQDRLVSIAEQPLLVLSHRLWLCHQRRMARCHLAATRFLSAFESQLSNVYASKPCTPRLKNDMPNGVQKSEPDEAIREPRDLRAVGGLKSHFICSQVEARSVICLCTVWSRNS